MPNASWLLHWLLWLHVYSFSPIYRPTTNKCPKYFRHSVRDLVQAASPVELKAALILRKTPDYFHRNQINPYFFLIPAVWTNPSLLTHSISSVTYEFHPYQVGNVPFSWKLTEINPWFIRGQNTCKLQSVLKAGTGRKRRQHLWLEILKHPWALGWLSGWSQHALLKMVLDTSHLILGRKLYELENSIVTKLWDWAETLLH